MSTVSMNSARARARGTGHRQRYSKAHISRPSLYETIEEEHSQRNPLGIAIQSILPSPSRTSGHASTSRTLGTKLRPTSISKGTLSPEQTRISTAILDDSSSSNHPPRPTAARTTPSLLCWASSYRLRKSHTWDLTRHGCYQRPRPFRSLPHPAAQRNSRRTSSSPGNQIDEQLKAEHLALKKQKYTARVLLFGRSESGKSTTTQPLAFSLAEICSKYPTSAGAYYWCCRLTSPKRRLISSWINGWLTMVGVWTISLSVTFGTAQKAAWEAESASWRVVIQLNIISSIITIVEALQAEMDGEAVGQPDTPGPPYVPATPMIAHPPSGEAQSSVSFHYDPLSDPGASPTVAEFRLPPTDHFTLKNHGRGVVINCPGKHQLLKLRLGPLRPVEKDLKRRLSQGAEEEQDGAAESLGPLSSFYSI
ncbi:hypothetical protein BDZ97DRAFT_1766380 [Flammula alnicola]|nr:hypothetical protein BDZ97DRAFT_1766380 [Flammula alnicola]